ncbi:MAG TPA: PhzF family phenazine biosynthesis isomerase [Gemmatimonadaceae bacterium]|nr:PhzF family phenazine biosynthesis isomerase [Gemmatimonadaceae bacterium]
MVDSKEAIVSSQNDSDLQAALSAGLIDRYTTNAARVRELAAPLTDAQFWHKPFPFGNSFGHLVLHLTGNLNYYIGAQIANTGYVRDRPREFADPTPPSKAEALDRFDDAIAMVLHTIRAQSSDDWSAAYSGVGATARTRLEMLIQGAAHIQHHIGQLIYLVYELGRHSPTRTPIYQVDAFATSRFAGNPAAVMPMPHFPPDATMQAIAAENNLSETAFLVPDGGNYRLRWFTPATEVPLCGHATLASAAVVMERLEPARRSVIFHSASGPLTISRTDTGYVMDFPSRPSEQISSPLGLAVALGVVPVAVFVNTFNYMAVFENAQAIRDLAPDMAALARLDRPGVIVTARGDGPYDFVSRYFAPAKGIPEDPVTGAAHCMLTPYWAAQLGKTAFRASQLSPRGGEIICRLAGDRVQLEGRCVFYLEGEVEV